MTAFRPGGKRRIDRVLAPEFIADLPSLPMEEVRERRHQAEQEEVDHSYVRRMLQGRIDILRAEQRRRSAGGDGDLVDHLAEVLADENPGPAFGLGRHPQVEPSVAGASRRRIERLVADVSLSDVSAQSDEELQGALDIFTEEERRVSAQRREVQRVMDRLGEELTRRYRDGEADVANLLAGDQS